MSASPGPAARGRRQGLTRGWPSGAAKLRKALLLIGGTGLGLLAVVTGALGFLLYHHAHPPRVSGSETPGAVFTRYEEAPFPSLDGVPLAGWWIPGIAGAPVTILCHNLGESRSSLLGLATLLSGSGYSVLLFDFRGHGASGGTSSFGALEKRDLLGAIDWVGGQKGAGGQRIGLVGVGMGAHAAVLAAAERPQVRCLVLDSPYPDAGTQFAASSLSGGVATRWLTPPAVLLYDIMYGVRSSEQSAARWAPSLADRDILFLAPRGEAAVLGAVRAMYESVPESKNHDKNLMVLPATRTTALYGDDRAHFDDAVLGFFRSYLPSSGTGARVARSGARNAAGSSGGEGGGPEQGPAHAVGDAGGAPRSGAGATRPDQLLSPSVSPPPT